jgi:AcrR family transcriptional regulator
VTLASPSFDPERLRLATGRPTVSFRNGVVPERQGERVDSRTMSGVGPGHAPELPRLGRPRDPSLDVAIVRATLDLLAEGGYAAVTMEAVAGRAGVGKATLYRRWPGKEQLVVDALAALAEPVELREGAAVRDQLVALLEGIQRRTGSLAGRIFPRLISEAVDNPELMLRYRRQVLEPRRQVLRDVLARGVREGLIRDDVRDGAALDHVADLLVGPIAYRILLRTDPPVAPDFAARVVDDVLAGLSPRTPAEEQS